MDNTAKDLVYYTADEYFEATKDTDELTELIGGLIYNSPSPGMRHQDIATGLVTELRIFVRKNHGTCLPFAAPCDVKIDENNVVVPDVFITCKPETIDTLRCYGAPDFVAEVTSTNRSNDFVRKLALYKDSGVREYWIIDLLKERVLVYFFEESDSPDVYDFTTPIPVRIWDSRLSITIHDLELL